MWTLTNLMWLLLSGVLAILLYLVFIYWRNWLKSIVYVRCYCFE